jgi:hypothetical protein
VEGASGGEPGGGGGNGVFFGPHHNPSKSMYPVKPEDGCSSLVIYKGEECGEIAAVALKTREGKLTVLNVYTGGIVVDHETGVVQILKRRAGACALRKKEGKAGKKGGEGPFKRYDAYSLADTSKTGSAYIIACMKRVRGGFWNEHLASYKGKGGEKRGGEKQA